MLRAGKRTKKLTFGFGLVTATVLAVIGLSWPHERLLLEMAHPILPVHTEHPNGFQKEKAFWLTSTRLLIITTDDDDNSTGKTQWTGHADLYDTVTRTRTHLTGLTKLLNQPGRFHGWRPYDFQASPTGSKLYWSIQSETILGKNWTTKFGSVIYTSDGSKVREWDSAGEPGLWADDLHFIAVPEDQILQEWQLSIHDAKDFHGDRLALNSHEAGSILAKYGENQLLGTRIYMDETHLVVSRRLFDIRSGQIVERPETIALPQETQFIGNTFELSPHTSMPILLLHSETPTLLAWLHRFFPSVLADTTVTEGVWLQRPGVQKLEEIGHIPVLTDGNGNIEGHQIEALQWLPDGKQISFIFWGTLYVVPVSTSK